MALKGSAKIELVNADGTREVVEHGNMITDAVNDLLYSPRGEQSNILRLCDNGDSFIEQIFGGILLFKHRLSDDKSDYYIPSIDTTGYANLNAYNGEDTERGSFNTTESGLQEDGSYNLVWDFTTSQANGVIQAIALCPNLMGKIGMSNSAVSGEKISATTKRPSVVPYSTQVHGNLLPTSGETEGLSNYYYNIFTVKDNVAYALHAYNAGGAAPSDFDFRKNGGILKIYRFIIANSGVKLGSKIGAAQYLDCIDVQLPSDFVSSLNTEYSKSGVIDYSYDCSSDILTLFPCFMSIVGKNQTFMYAEIELSSFSAVSKTFTNNADGTIYGSNNVYAYSDYGYFENKYFAKDYVFTGVLCSDNAARFYVTRKSDNTDIKEVKFYDGREFTRTNTQVYYRACQFRPIFSFGNIFVFGFSRDTQYTDFTNVYVLDMSTGLLKETNAKEMTYRSNIQLENKATWGKTGTYLGLSITVNPFILTTKNNLDSPVTKTASQTMKITYTLTETEGA